MKQEEKDIRKQLKEFEDDIYASKMRYNKIEDEEQELGSHNLSFHQVIEQLMVDEQDEAIYRRIQGSLVDLNEDYKKALTSIYDMKCTELERQRMLNFKIEDYQIELRKESEA